MAQPTTKRLVTEASFPKALSEDWTEQLTAHVFGRPAADDVPSIVWAGTDATGLSSPVVYKPEKVGIGSNTASWDGLSDPTFRYFSGNFGTGNGGSGDAALYGNEKPGGASQAARWPLAFSFDTGVGVSVVEVAGYHLGGGSTAGVLIEVNGRMFSDTVISKTSTLTGNGFRFTLTFPTARVRRIRVWANGGFGLIAVRVPTGQTITKPAEAITRRVAFIGDSFVNGAGESSNYPNQGAGIFESFAPRLGRLMAADDMVLAGIGGTGWVAGGSTNAYSTRIAAVLAMNPHVLVFYGSINDGAAGTGVQAAVQSALAQVAAVPKVFVIGPLLSGYDANHEAVRAATESAGRIFIDMRAFINGTGNALAPTGVGNRGYFLMSDNAHPTFVAHKAIAEAAFRKIRVA